MAASAFERVVRRDRAIVATALALIAILAWAYVARLAHHRHMAGADAAADASMAGMMRPVMNVAWIAAIAVLVLLEKVMPRGRMLARAVGAALILGGVWLAAGGFG